MFGYRHKIGFVVFFPRIMRGKETSQLDLWEFDNCQKKTVRQLQAATRAKLQLISR